LTVEKEIVKSTDVLIWLNYTNKRYPGGWWRHTGSNEKIELNTEMLEQILDSSEITKYKIVTAKEDFTEEMRSNIYNTYIIFSDRKYYVSKNIAREIQEHVYNGAGLITSIWDNGTGMISLGWRNKNYSEMLGVDIKGNLPGKEHTVNNPEENNICGICTFSTKEKARKLEIIDTESVEVKAYFEYKGMWNNEKYPAIITNNYGKGKVVYMAFDYGISLKETNLSEMSTILRNSIKYVKPESKKYLPGHTIEMDIRLISRVTKLNVAVEEFVDNAATILKISEEHNAAGNNINWNFILEEGESKQISYTVKIPDRADTYSFETKVSYLVRGLYYTPSELEKITAKVGIEFSSENYIDKVISKLNEIQIEDYVTVNGNGHGNGNGNGHGWGWGAGGWRNSDWSFMGMRDEILKQQAIQEIQQLKNMNIRSQTMYEISIDHIMEAIGYVVNIKSVETEEQREYLYNLLTIQEMNYYKYSENMSYRSWIEWWQERGNKWIKFLSKK
jgi:type 1 glutamine amidotransferase